MNTVRIEVVVTDLWAESDGGWSANGSWANRTEIEVPESASELAIARAIKRAAGIQGWRTDSWCSADWVWRNGTLGAYADVID